MGRPKNAYGLTKPLEKIFPSPVIAGRAPTSSDTKFPLGQTWIYNSIVYMLANVASGSASWTLVGPGSSDVDTLGATSGDTTVTPTAGKITLTAGTNITTTGSDPGSITLATSASPTFSTSVTSADFTAAGGSDLQLTAPSGQDAIITLGDSAGATNFIVEALDGTDVFTVDSSGTISFTNLANTGTFTTSGGTVSLNASSNFNTVINSGTSSGMVTIGNGSAGAIAVDTGAGISLDAATASNFTVTGAADLTLASTAGSIPVTAGEAAADAIVLEASHGDGGVQIKAGTGGVLIGNEADTTTLDLGNIAPTASRTTTIGGGTVVTASVTDTIDIGPDGATTNADSIKTVNINTGGVTTGEVLTNIATGAITSGTHTLLLQSGNVTAGTVTMGLGTGTGTKTIGLGNGDGNTTFNVSAITNINDSVNADTAINTGTSTGTITVGNSAAGAVAVDTAAGISLDAATASNFTVTGAADLTLTSTAGSIPITAGEADAAAIALQAASGGLDIDLGLAMIADAAGNIELNSSAGQILIGNDDVDQNADFATDGERTVTVGSTNGAAALVLQAGTGEITVTGTVKEIDGEFVEASGDEISSISQSPILTTAANTAGAATGANGDVNLMYLQQGVLMEQFIIGTQTIIGPRMDANGLLVSLDLTGAEGAEYNFGGARTNSRHAFTIGTSAAFFFEVGLYINDMDGAAPYVIGFRKSEANNATMASYSDYAAIGMNAASSVTNIVTMTELNGGGQTVTDTTDAWGGDGTTHTLRVLVDASGNVTYTIDGSAPSSVAAFQFDNTDVVVPYIHLLHSASATQVDITSLKVGFQA